MPRLKRGPTQAVPNSYEGANGALGRVLAVGAKPKQANPFPGTFTPNPRPFGNPTGKGTKTG